MDDSGLKEWEDKFGRPATFIDTKAFLASINKNLERIADALQRIANEK